jgi:predicted ATP-grasp superfamily ATP-dependent carboligase
MTMEPLRWHSDREGLNEPIMLAAFVRKSGYGTTAVASLTHLVTAHDGELIAEIEPEDFFDFTVTSPMLERRDGEHVLAWPQNRIYRLQRRGSARDVVVLLGTEPHLHWGGFARALRQFMSEAGVRELVVVYSWPAAVPHTRPIRLRLTTEDADLAGRLAIAPTPLEYVGPVDFATTLITTLEQVRGAGLSALVPNYLGIVPNPFAMIALVEAYDRLCQLHTDISDIRELAEQVRIKADEGVAESSELAEALRRMEQEYEATTDAAPALSSDEGDADSLPSPSELLRDVEAFLNKDKDAPS